MAVAGPFAPNLSGSYQNIQEALTQGANIASKMTGPAGTVAAGLQPLADEAQKNREQLLKYTLEDHLNQNKERYGAQAAGKKLVTPDDAGKFFTEMGLDSKAATNIFPEEGIYQTPDDMVSIATKLQRHNSIETLASQFDDGTVVGKKKANLIRLSGNDPQGDQIAARLAGISKPIIKVNPADGLNHIYDEMSGQDMGIAPGSSTPNNPGNSSGPAIKDIPSLRRVDKSQADALDNASKAARTDPQLKSLASSLDQLGDTRTLIEKNIPGTQINIGADAARAIGGVPGGRFTALMAAGEGKDKSLLATLGQGYQTATMGNLSPHNQQLLLNEVDTAARQKRKELASALSEKHQQVKSDVPYASDDLIASQLGYQRYLSSPENTPSIPTLSSQAEYDALPNGSQYIDDSGKVKTKGKR